MMFIPNKNDPERISEYIKEAIQHYKTRAEAAEKYADKTREEINVAAEKKNQEEIQYLKDKFDLVYGCFKYPQEMERWEAFNKKHHSCRSKYKMGCGKAPYIIPYGTPLGMMFTAVCQACGEKEDITYTEGW